jgi:hypothetical protein
VNGRLRFGNLLKQLVAEPSVLENLKRQTLVSLGELDSVKVESVEESFVFTAFG